MRTQCCGGRCWHTGPTTDKANTLGRCIQLNAAAQDQGYVSPSSSATFLARNRGWGLAGQSFSGNQGREERVHTLTSCAYLHLQHALPGGTPHHAQGSPPQYRGLSYPQLNSVASATYCPSQCRTTQWKTPENRSSTDTQFISDFYYVML